jgi:endonuclease III
MYNPEIINKLKKAYPEAKIALNYQTPWELLVAVILSAQCTDKMVNRVTEKLFKKYPSLDSYAYANQSEFENDIRSTGFFRNKAKHILETAKIIKETYNGEIPRTIKDLTLLPGIARKTANVVLSNAFHSNEGIAVDTHVIRLSQRLRLVSLESIGGKNEVIIINSKGEKVVDFKKDADPVKIEKELIKTIAKKDWYHITYLLIDHGRAICKAQNPNCEVCVLRTICDVSRI